jgi:hypothetical protein
MGSQHEKYVRTHRSSIRTVDLYRREQRDTLILLLCMAFMLGSLSSFLSLLSFYPSGDTSTCGKNDPTNLTEEASF